MTPRERFDQNRGLAYHVARRYKVPAEDREDLLQEAELALWKACLGYDEGNSAAFSTYAGRAIANACYEYSLAAWNSSGLSASKGTRLAAYKSQQSDGGVEDRYKPLFETALSTEYLTLRDSDDGTTIGDAIATEDEYGVYNEDAHRVLLAALGKTLSDKRRDIVVLRYGLDGREPMTYREIGDELGMCDERVRQELNNALVRLRHPRCSAALSSLVGEP